jgi:hypothetical protein
MYIYALLATLASADAGENSTSRTPAKIAIAGINGNVTIMD